MDNQNKNRRMFVSFCFDFLFLVVDVSYAPSHGSIFFNAFPIPVTLVIF